MTAGRGGALNLTASFDADSNYSFPPSWMGGNLSYYDEYAALPDVLTFDIYPVTGWNQPSWLYIPGSEASGKPFDFMVRQAGTTVYLFVANAHMGSTSETLTFIFPQALSSVTVWGTSQTVPTSGNVFTDTLGPIGVRIYQVTF